MPKELGRGLTAESCEPRAESFFGEVSSREGLLRTESQSTEIRNQNSSGFWVLTSGFWFRVCPCERRVLAIKR